VIWQSKISSPHKSAKTSAGRLLLPDTGRKTEKK
jgi:hypothetical protein